MKEYFIYCSNKADIAKNQAQYLIVQIAEWQQQLQIHNSWILFYDRILPSSLR